MVSGCLSKNGTLAREAMRGGESLLVEKKKKKQEKGKTVVMRRLRS